MQVIISADNLSIAAVVIATGALIVAVITLLKVIKQTELIRKQTDYIRKQVFGELYETAQISDLQFYIPAKWEHAVEDPNQKENDPIELGKSTSIPVGQERELHIKWKMTESQTLRSFTIGFDIPEGQSSSFQNNPEVIEKTVAFVKKSFSVLPREEYIDWHGVYHCEYGHARRLPKDEAFVISLKVKGREAGKYVLNVEIQVSEAPNPFRGNLEVECV